MAVQQLHLVGHNFGETQHPGVCSWKWGVFPFSRCDRVIPPPENRGDAGAWPGGERSVGSVSQGKTNAGSYPGLAAGEICQVLKKRT